MRWPRAAKWGAAARRSSAARARGLSVRFIFTTKFPARLAPVAVQDGGLGDEDDLSAGVTDAKAPVRVVPAQEDALVEGSCDVGQRRPEELARSEHVKHRARARMVEVGHQVPADHAAVLEQPA